MEGTTAKAVKSVSWKVAGSSARGASHLRSGLPNQDACDYWVAENGAAAVLAVADGHGSHRHFRSHIGATLAVGVAIPVVKEFIAKKTESASWEETANRELPWKIVEQWVAAVLANFQQSPFIEEELSHLAAEDAEGKEMVTANPVIAYGATLLTAAVTQDGILYLQLGDGDILAVDDAGKTSRPLPADERLIGNQTTSLCQPESWKELRVRVVTGQRPALVLLSTDGYANSFRSEEDFLQIGHDYLSLIQERGLEQIVSELPGILEEASKQGSGDDITLGILQREGTSPVGGGKPSAKSEAIARLQTDYAAQQEKLRALESSHLRTRKTLRQLRLLLAVLVIAGGGYFAVRYWRNPGAKTAPVVKTHDSDKPAAPGVKPEEKWFLDIGVGKISLRVGTKLTSKELGLGGDKNEAIAEVISMKDGPALENVSKVEWTVTASGQKPVKRGKKGVVPLEAGTKIEFGKVAGVISAAKELKDVDDSTPGAR